MLKGMAIKKGLKGVRISPLVRENIKVALRSIRNNRLRSVLTILMVAVGITSLLGILTATDTVKNEVSNSFDAMGAGYIAIFNNRVYRTVVVVLIVAQKDYGM